MLKKIVVEYFLPRKVTKRFEDDLNICTSFHPTVCAINHKCDPIITFIFKSNS